MIFRRWPPLEGRRLVFGIGTGRSASLSLAALLTAQPGASVTHEFARLRDDGKPRRRFMRPLPWEVSERRLRRAVGRLLRLPGPVVGDVGSFWLPYLPTLLALYPGSRVACLERPRDEVIASFVRKTGRRNHWMAHDGRRWEHDPFWDPVFPKYEAASKEEAIGAYWDDYRSRVAALARSFPGAIRSWPVEEAINSEEGRTALLTHLGFPFEAHVHPQDLHLNRSR